MVHSRSFDQSQHSNGLTPSTIMPIRSEISLSTLDRKINEWINESLFFVDGLLLANLDSINIWQAAHRELDEQRNLYWMRTEITVLQKQNEDYPRCPSWSRRTKIKKARLLQKRIAKRLQGAEMPIWSLVMTMSKLIRHSGKQSWVSFC